MKKYFVCISLCFSIFLFINSGCSQNNSAAAQNVKDTVAVKLSSEAAIRTFTATTAAELQDYMENAEPGDRILVASGTYSGSLGSTSGEDARGMYFSKKSGTAANPIILEAADPENMPVLVGAGVDKAIVLYLKYTSYWEVRNLKVTTGQKGIVIDQGTNNIIYGCEVYGVGQEGIHFRDNSSLNTAAYCSVHDTGTGSSSSDKGYGEGVYVGTDKGSWSTYGEACYDNIITHCALGPNVTAEHVDIKEGTRRTIVEYCTLNGTGISGSNSATSFIDAKGIDAEIRYNTGYRNSNTVLTAAFHVNNRGTTDSGTGNWFYNNALNMDSDTSCYIVMTSEGTCTYKVWNNTRTPSGNMYATASSSTYTEVNPGSAESVPSVPTGLAAGSITVSSITLSWTASSSATSYNIYRSATSAGTYSVIGTSASTSYTDSSLSSATTYYYKVSAVNSVGESVTTEGVGATTSSTSSTIPATPAELTAGSTTTVSVTLSWSASSGATSYKIYRSATSAGTYSVIGTSASTSYIDASLSSGTTYFYEVSAVNSSGESAKTSYISATTTSGNSSNGAAKIQYACSETSTSASSIKADLKIVNTGTSTITLSELKIRYYFTNDSLTDVFAVRYANAGSSNITGTFGGSGTAHYAEVGFTSNAGTLAAGGSTTVKITVHDSSWADYDQSNDYSFDASLTSFTDSSKVSIYQNDSLIWGTPSL